MAQSSFTDITQMVDDFRASFEDLMKTLKDIGDTIAYVNLRAELQDFYSLRAKISQEIAREGLQDGLLPDTLTSRKEAPKT